MKIAEKYNPNWWIYYDVIINAISTFMYLFVVYFSFAPVILAGIHRYVNYSDIQVLMMVTNTETFNVDFA